MNRDELIAALRAFADDRNWGQFHTPKNLVMALSGEVGELTEIFQWLTPDESSAITDHPDRAARVAEELADVYAYLLLLADRLGISLDDALTSKIAVNTEKYPINRAYGNATKYNERPH